MDILITIFIIICLATWVYEIFIKPTIHQRQIYQLYKIRDGFFNKKYHSKEEEEAHKLFLKHINFLISHRDYFTLSIFIKYLIKNDQKQNHSFDEIKDYINQNSLEEVGLITLNIMATNSLPLVVYTYIFVLPIVLVSEKVIQAKRNIITWSLQEAERI